MCVKFIIMKCKFTHFSRKTYTEVRVFGGNNTTNKQINKNYVLGDENRRGCGQIGAICFKVKKIPEGIRQYF